MKLSRRKLSEHAATRLLAGDAKKTVLQELAAYLIENGRTREQELIVRDIEAKLLANGVALVTVTAARPLSSEAKSAIEAMVKADDPEVTRVLLSEVLDPSVIGGARVELAGKMADMTVKAKLDKLVV